MRSVPEVSVVIPTRDRWPLLCAAGLRAALAQSDVSMEVIVVDDGSEQESPPPHPTLEDPRVRVVQASRRGQAAARNHGIALARGPWIAFLDDDDLWSPRKLRSQLDVAATAGAELVYCGAVLAGESGTWPLRLPTPSELRSWLTSSSAIPAGASNVLVRSEVARQVGGFDETFSHLTDWDLWIRLEEVAQSAACEDALVAMRMHDQNLRTSSTRSVWPEFRRLAEKRRSAGGADLDGRALIQWIAFQHARSGRRGEAAWWYARAGTAGRNLAFLSQAVRVLVTGGTASAPTVPGPAWLADYD